MSKGKERWVWCLHCERVSVESEWVRDSDNFGVRTCPYEGCDGGLMGDGWDYYRTRAGDSVDPRMEHWPEKPERGVVYPLYP